MGQNTYPFATSLNGAHLFKGRKGSSSGSLAGRTGCRGTGALLTVSVDYSAQSEGAHLFDPVRVALVEKKEKKIKKTAKAPGKPRNSYREAGLKALGPEAAAATAAELRRVAAGAPVVEDWADMQKKEEKSESRNGSGGV